MILKKLVPIVAAVFFMFAFVGCGGGGGESVVDIDTNQSTTSNSPPSNNTPSNNTTNSSTPSECTDSWQTSADIDETRKTGADLLAVYNQISKGMSADQVMGILGAPPARLTRINGYVYMLHYQNTAGAELAFSFEASCHTPQNRILAKTVAVSKGSFVSYSEHYDY